MRSGRVAQWGLIALLRQLTAEDKNIPHGTDVKTMSTVVQKTRLISFVIGTAPNLMALKSPRVIKPEAQS